MQEIIGEVFVSKSHLIVFLFRKERVLPRHILLAVRNDTELDCLLNRVVMKDGGVMPTLDLGEGVGEWSSDEEPEIIKSHLC